MICKMNSHQGHRITIPHKSFEILMDTWPGTYFIFTIHPKSSDMGMHPTSCMDTFFCTLSTDDVEEPMLSSAWLVSTGARQGQSGTEMTMDPH